MSNNYHICGVIVTLPSLGTVTTDAAGNERKSKEECRVHLYAVRPDWRDKGSVFEGFLVGRLVVRGSAQFPSQHTVRIMMPDGYKLIALRIGEDEQPLSWDSLPVLFTGGFVVGDGETFINDTFIEHGEITSHSGANYTIKVNTSEKGERYTAGMQIGVENGDKKVRFLAERFKVGQEPDLRVEVAPIGAGKIKFLLSEDMKEQVNEMMADAIRNALKPGGLLWNNRGGR